MEFLLWMNFQIHSDEIVHVYKCYLIKATQFSVSPRNGTTYIEFHLTLLLELRYLQFITEYTEVFIVLLYLYFYLICTDNIFVLSETTPLLFTPLYLLFEVVIRAYKHALHSPAWFPEFVKLDAVAMFWPIYWQSEILKITDLLH